MKRTAAALLLLGSLAVATGGRADARQPPTTDAPGEVPSLVREGADRPTSVPLPWELPGVTFPLLEHDRSIEATSEDNAQLVFIDGNELGSFRPAQQGGSPFFGSGQPIFGMAAPPVLPSRVLRPLGAGDAGDRFLGQRPPVEPDTVIPKLAETFDRSRESFAFVEGVPPIPEPVRAGSTPFPLLDTVAADPTRDCPDNLLSCAPRDPGGAGTTATTQPPGSPPAPEPAPRPPGTVPTTTPRPTVPPPLPPTGTTLPPPTIPTTLPPPTVPPTTAPPTTSPPMTVPPTTAPPTTVPPTPTTTVPATPPTTIPSAMLVLGNQVEADSGPGSVSAVTRDLCLSNAQPSSANPGCDRLFAFGEGPGRHGFLRLGRQYFVNLTLWNVQTLSTMDATDLRVHAPAACTSEPTPAASADSICRAIKLRIQRYEDAARTIPVECVYGGGAGNTCQWSSSKTLADFGATHTSMASGAPIGGAFPVNRKAYLRIFVMIDDTGVDAHGIGNDNRYLGQRANLRFRWQMQSG